MMNTIAWLDQLIRFDTTSHLSNLPLIDCIEPWLKKYNLMTRRSVHPTEAKANLFATLPAKDGSTQGGIIFSGHTDVVPVRGQDWDTNPFMAVQKEGRIYGRGACDMKGFLAAMLSAVPALSEMKLASPVHFAFSYDEEVGCLGARVLIEDLQAAGIKADACIVGEPTSMRPVIAHKGIQAFHCLFHGNAAHSSLTPQACNAIDYAAKLICHIRDMAETYRKSGPFDDHFDVPYTTMSTNKISGGTASNIVPADCEFMFEFRNLPNVQPELVMEYVEHFVHHNLLPAMHHEYPHAQIEIRKTGSAPGFESARDNKICRLASQLTQDDNIHKVSYATEAGLFQQAHIPTIVCGPGSIEQAHRPNEFVEIAQLEQCEQFLLDMAKAW